MTADELLNLIDALKMYINESLHNIDVHDDDSSKKMLLTINDMFERLGIAAAEVLPPEIASAYFNAMDEAAVWLSEQGLATQKLAVVNGAIIASFKTKANINAISNITNDTMMDLLAAIRTAQQNFNKNYEKTLKQVRADLQRGLLQGDNREKIIKRVSESFKADGFTSFTTVDGKRLPLDFYARTVTRTKLQTAKNHGHLARYEDAGLGLVMITGAEPTCGECAKYRNRVFSIDGKDKRFPYLDVYAEYPRHPNCKCIIRPFVEKYKSQEEMNEAIAKTKSFNPNKDPRTQKQRDAYKKDQQAKATARQEDKDYAIMVSILGDRAPKNVGVYRRYKRNNPKKFAELQAMMRGEA